MSSPCRPSRGHGPPIHVGFSLSAPPSDVLLMALYGPASLTKFHHPSRPCALESLRRLSTRAHSASHGLLDDSLEPVTNNEHPRPFHQGGVVRSDEARTYCSAVRVVQPTPAGTRIERRHLIPTIIVLLSSNKSRPLVHGRLPSNWPDGMVS